MDFPHQDVPLHYLDFNFYRIKSIVKEILTSSLFRMIVRFWSAKEIDQEASKGKIARNDFLLDQDKNFNIIPWNIDKL